MCNGCDGNDTGSTMQDNGSRLQETSRRERLEDRYKKIAIPALAAAIDAGKTNQPQRQMAAERPEWMQLDAQS